MWQGHCYGYPNVYCIFWVPGTTYIWNNPLEGSVRLLKFPSNYGELQVYLKGLWGAVCADHFTKAEADSVCRQLGYTDSNGYQPTK